ncbi:MAG: ABC transporter permease subunit [Victivallales bacterium]|nr:ABC transporter permease subunit [Victivallales bacterium]
MGIISEIGRKNFRVRILIWAISLSLIIGAATMLYTFMLMLGGSSKSSVDKAENRLIPGFLTDETTFYRKSVEAIFNEQAELFQSCYDLHNGDFKQLELPAKANIDPELVHLWNRFIRERNYPHYYYTLSFIAAGNSANTIPINLRRFKSILSKRFNGNLQKLNREMQLEIASWSELRIIIGIYLTPIIMPDTQTELYNVYYAFKEKFFDGSKKAPPLANRTFVNPEGYYKTLFLRNQYTQYLGNFNAEHKTAYKSWTEIKLPRRYPADKNKYTDLERKDWEEFVRKLLNRLWIKVSRRALPAYQTYLRARYNNDINALNKWYETKYKNFSEIELLTDLKQFPFFGTRLSDWDSYIRGWTDSDDGKFYQLPVEYLEVTGAIYDFRDYLKEHFKTIAAANKKLKNAISSWDDVRSQEQASHYLWIKQHASALKWEFLIRNFVSVFDYIMLHGYAVWNTFVYCGCAVLCALIVNPLAAYALSRFNPPSTYKILLFLMVTMAFPPLVTQIPVFLMLREFNLLNTYAALILPGLANGYSIFLLKGFFDSLPRELYESAQIDGAGEARIFFQVTLSLSKPILAVIALNTFQFAYTNFMMALLYCQDKRMWTIMPWLYQLQLYSCRGIVYSSLIVAAVPTFLVFVFCQNIIMRGIVIPTEK